MILAQERKRKLRAELEKKLLEENKKKSNWWNDWRQQHKYSRIVSYFILTYIVAEEYDKINLMNVMQGTVTFNPNKLNNNNVSSSKK